MRWLNCDLVKVSYCLDLEDKLTNSSPLIKNGKKTKNKTKQTNKRQMEEISKKKRFSD
jgi:hypothetical protein